MLAIVSYYDIVLFKPVRKMSRKLVLRPDKVLIINLIYFHGQ